MTLHSIVGTLSTTFLAMLCILSSSIGLSAQPIGPDIRLLDLMRFNQVPQDLKIQAADKHNGVVLAVWGTLRQTDQQTVLPALMVESKSGTQRFLTNLDERPFGFVSVIDVESGFLVLWNDSSATDRPGVLGVMLAADGTPLSEHFLFNGSGLLFSAPIVQGSATGTTLLYQHLDAGDTVILGARVHVDGRLDDLGIVSRTGGIVHHLSFRRRAGGLFLRTARGEVLVDQNGVIDRSPIPPYRFARPFFFEGEEGLVTTDDQGYLVKYDPYNADQPVWRAPVAAGYLPWKDSAGYHVARITESGVSHAFIRFKIMTTTTVRTLDGSPLPAPIADTLEYMGHHNDANPQFSQSPKKTEVVADGLIRHSFRWSVVYKPGGSQHTYRSSTDIVLEFDSRGVLGGSAGNLLGLSCWREGSSREARVNASGLRFRSPFPLLNHHVESSFPAIAGSDEGFVVGGLVDSYHSFSISFARGGLLGEVLQGPSGAGVPLPSYQRAWNRIPFSRFSTDTSSRYDHLGDKINSATTRWEAYLLGPQGWGWREITSGWVGGPVSFPKPISLLDHYDPNRDVRIMFCTYLPPYRVSRYYYPFAKIVTHDLQSDSLTEVQFGAQVPLYDILPKSDTSLLHFRTPLLVSPIGEGAWNSTEPSETMTLLPFGDATAYVHQRLYGGRWIRAIPRPGSNRLSLELYDFNGVRVKSLALPLEGDTSAPFIVQSSSDSTIAVLVQTDEGPVVHLMDQRLEPVYRASGTAIGALRLAQRVGPTYQGSLHVDGDTIYAVWTDDRLGKPDIYVNAVALPIDRWVQPEEEPPYDYWEQYQTGDPDVIDQLTPAERQEVFGFAIYGAEPNPAYERVTLRIGSSYSQGAYIEIFDALGAQVYSGLLNLAPGVNLYALPDAPTESGLYQIRVRSVERSEEVMVHFYGE